MSHKKDAIKIKKGLRNLEEAQLDKAGHSELLKAHTEQQMLRAQESLLQNRVNYLERDENRMMKKRLVLRFILATGVLLRFSLM